MSLARPTSAASSPRPAAREVLRAGWIRAQGQAELVHKGKTPVDIEFSNGEWHSVISSEKVEFHPGQRVRTGFGQMQGKRCQSQWCL